jgi:hypothetical protein
MWRSDVEGGVGGGIGGAIAGWYVSLGVLTVLVGLLVRQWCNWNISRECRWTMVVD